MLNNTDYLLTQLALGGADHRPPRRGVPPPPAPKNPLPMSRSTSSLPSPTTILLRTPNPMYASNSSSPMMSLSSTMSDSGVASMVTAAAAITPPTSYSSSSSSAYSSPTPMSMSLDDFLGAGTHVVRLNMYAEQPTLESDVSRRNGLVGVEPVYALLDRLVGKTLANPVAAPCANPVASIQAPAKSGARSAVHTWAATSIRRVNVVTWCYFDAATEVSHTFFSRLMAFAASKAPAILLLHRISERAPPEIVRELYDQVWKSYYAFYDQRTTAAELHHSVPPFWLVMLDRWSASQILPAQWGCALPNTVVIAGFSGSQKAAYLAAMVEQELARRLARRDDVPVVMAEYAASLAEIAAVESFENPRDITEYVRLLFSLPVDRHTVETLAGLGDVVARYAVLPEPGGDFHTALSMLRRLKEDVARQQDIAAQAAAAAQRAETNARLGSLMPGGGSGIYRQ